jgi:tetratricopeptide (TPR) repeat protein
MYHKLETMPKILISVFLFAFFSGISSFAQESERYLEVRGTSELEMQPLSNATADLYEGTNKIQSIQTAADGSFSFRLEINKQYTIEVVKNGLVGKKISFNTTMPDEEKGKWMNEFSIGLVKYCDGVDYSALKEPVDIVKFDPKRRQYVSDKDYVGRMRPRIENVLANYDQCMMDKYDAAIKKGNSAYQQKNMQEAIAAYKEAQEIYPRETFPAKQINEINNQMNKQQKSAENSQKQEQENALKQEQEKQKEEQEKLKQEQEIQRQKQQDIEDNYNQVLAKASVAYTRNDYGNARQYYQEALKIKPAEALPKSRMAEIETILAKKASEDAKVNEVNNAYRSAVTKADSLMKVKNYPSAQEQYAKASLIKPGEAYPKTKSQEIDHIKEANIRAVETAKKANEEKEYQAILDNADALFKAKSYDEAKAAYSKALAMRPSDPYPTQRVKLVENTQQAEKQKTLENQALKQYKEVIASADQYLEAKELVKSRDAYTRALAIKPDDEYAKSKITTIDNMVAADQAARLKATEDGYKAAIGAANTAITQKTYPQAKEYLQKALTIKPGDAYTIGKIAEVDKMIQEQKKSMEQEQLALNQYKEGVTAADKLFNAGDLPAARKAFTDLYKIKPGDPYASQKISSIDDLLAVQLAKKQKDTDDAYSNVMTKGTGLMVQKDYNRAIEAFRQALTIRQGDLNASNKLKEAEMLIAQEQDRVASEKAKKKSYDDNIARGDQFMTLKNYSGARQSFEEALMTMPGESYPREKLDEITQIMNEQARIQNEKQAAENAYSIAIISGDKYFKAKDYLRSKDEYTRASSLKPEADLPKSRITEIDNIIKIQEQEQAQAKARADAYTRAMNEGNMQLTGKNYAAAKISYLEALKVMPDDKLAKEQVARIDKILLSIKKPVVKKEVVAAAPVEKPKVNNALSELNFKTESERQYYLDELKKKYPAGITLEKYTEQYKEILRYVIIREDKAQEYRQVRFLTYNGYQYSVSGKPITQQYFQSQVKTRQGESFQEIDMQ